MKSAIHFLSVFVLVSVVTVKSSAQVPPPPPSPSANSSSVSEIRSGTIRGRVTTADGQPLTQLRVNVSVLGGRQFGGQRQVTVDDEGNFHADGLAAGIYQVFASMPGYVTQQEPGDEPQFRRFYRTGDTVNVTLIRGGVITGKIINASGDPVIGVTVTLERVRDAEGQPSRQGSGLARTDDRGIYRIFGIAPGTYLVKAGGRDDFSGPIVSPYSDDVATYYPSATRDTASEITVRSSDEINGVDIRYRGERGHSISGKVLSKAEPGSRAATQINLSIAGTGITVGSAFQSDRDENSGFAVYGVADGEYELIARRFNFQEQGGSAVSQARKVTVKGADVSGIELTLAPLASIAGKVVLEKHSITENAAEKNTCQSPHESHLEEILITAKRDDATPRRADEFNFFARNDFNPVNRQGEFRINNLEADRWRLNIELPDETWFVKHIVSGNASGTATKPATRGAVATLPTRNLFSVRADDKLSEVNVTIAEGAASLKGKVAAEKNSGRMRVHLVPTEATQSEDVLRYYETITSNEGEFSFKHLAPGQYWLLARTIQNDESGDRLARPIAWNEAERTRLRKEAEAANVVIELKPCQKLSDVVVKSSAK